MQRNIEKAQNAALWNKLIFIIVYNLKIY